MIAAVTRAAVLVPPTAPLSWKQIVDCGEQVVVAPGPYLHQGHARGGVRDENRYQPVAERRREPGDIERDVEDPRMGPGLEHDHFADHVGSIRSAGPLGRLGEPGRYLFVHLIDFADFEMMDPVFRGWMSHFLEAWRVIVAAESYGKNNLGIGIG